mmetsp:Transcript_13055/g.31986  ORF Transcript_13055/g.31986 Transcript_13055/m.31986 type:complete len:124 (+) Transcript_13055:145-516(+)
MLKRNRKLRSISIKTFFKLFKHKNDNKNTYLFLKNLKDNDSLESNIVLLTNFKIRNTIIPGVNMRKNSNISSSLKFELSNLRRHLNMLTKNLLFYKNCILINKPKFNNSDDILFKFLNFLLFY